MKNNTQDLSKDNNINSGDKKQPNCNDKSAKRKEFDVFISYRHLDTKKTEKNPDHKHTTSLAWSIYQALESKGFHVFFDCAYNLEDTIPAIDKCRCFIILITQDSIDAIKTYSFEKIKTMLENNERGDGFNYVKELYEIENRINQEPIDEKKTIAIDKRNVFLLNIDDRRTGTDISDILKGQHYNKLGEIISTPFETDQRFKASIDGLIKPNNGSGNRLRKKVQFFNKEIPWPRFSFKSCKALSWIGLVFLVLSMLLGYWLYQYLRTPIIFAGGGTVQQYIKNSEKYHHIDVSNYRQKPGSKYIHIPSTIAWQLLWEDVNEEEHRQYCPIVLSTGKISTNKANNEKFKQNNKRIVEYKLDSIALMAQINDGKNRKGTITLDSLKNLLNDAKETNYANYEIWTTTEHSGTYLEYKRILKEIDTLFDLDDIVNKQKGGRKDFNLENLTISQTKTQIILANEHYYYTNDDEKTSELIVVSNKRTKYIPLYIYTIAKKSDSSPVLNILPEAKDFLNSIGCDVDTKRTTNYKPDSIVVDWPKRK